jgi:hypothetical protein
MKRVMLKNWSPAMTGEHVPVSTRFPSPPPFPYPSPLASPWVAVKYSCNAVTSKYVPTKEEIQYQYFKHCKRAKPAVLLTLKGRLTRIE